MVLTGTLITISMCAAAAGQASQACTREEQYFLLRLARDTLRMHLDEHRVPSVETAALSPRLREQRGVFVTLKRNRTNELRGCIGYVVGFKPLAEAVIECTVYAASHDRRFRPMQPGEDKSVGIELSVLTAPQKITDPRAVEIGTHGLIIKQGSKSGLLLPQVPVEMKWDRTRFLQAVCRKAGLPENAWEKGSELFVFTAQVFSEHKFSVNKNN